MNKKFRFYIKIVILILITMIGCYGIIKAPKSDKDILERELEENERALQQAADSQTNTSEPSGTNSAVTNVPEPTPPESSPSKVTEEISVGENSTASGDNSDSGSSLTPFPDGDSDGTTDTIKYNHKNNTDGKTDDGKTDDGKTDVGNDSDKDKAGKDKDDKDKTETPDESGKNISVIGDSVFLGASPSFKEIYKDAVIDAKVSRQVSQGLDIAKELKKNGRLGSTVIISLGTNGNFNESTGQELIDYLGSDRTIWWINAYGKKLDIQDDVNKTIKKLAEENDNVHVISWDKKAKKHSDWFYQDGIHLNKDGQEGFAKFVSDAISGGE